ncbi:sensor histidine kinase KdpD [uncultured Caulobacter sp.]|uniref:sensor histidine kinase n=1 Tax=uncultured Caulobacter sp. TaxID=158749 RepID=UPI002613C0AE|nr:HAMP domain-containing sensor histidine kinase [uncultured Caulobacter sp.]
MPQPASADASIDRSFAEPASLERRRAAAERRRLALDDRKRSFLRMVSHELRTPLNAVIGFSEILSQELYGPLGAPQYKEYAAIVHESGLKLLKLVNQIVELARLEGHVTDIELTRENLDEAFADVIHGLKAEIARRDVIVHVVGEGALPCALADRRGLRTMLTNLLQNAVTHSPAGGVVHVSAIRIGLEIEIAIRDQGPGVETAELPRLLRPFEQGGSALTRTTEGAGLGLPIVDLLSRAMGGQLKLSSSLGAGFLARLILQAG